MKKTVTIQLTGILIAGFLIFWIPSCNNKKSNKPAAATLVNTDCNCEADWFPHNQTPAPPEGIGSPFDTSSTTNCIFHQWSWQKFLWLTKPVASGRALFEDSLILVDNQMIPVTPLSGVPLVLEDTGQAGSDGVLRSNPAFGAANTDNTVYYSIYISSILQKTADSIKQMLIKDSSLVKNNQFTFPVGSLELKVSWIDVSSLPADQVKNYYTSEAIIKSSGKKTTVALLGMHVVGVVINHPEFIWATFEHRDMAPVYDWKNTTNQDVPVTSADEKLFFKKGDTATWENLQWNTKTPNPGAQSVFSVYPLGVPRMPTDTFMITSQAGALNYDNIQGLNTCVAAGLKDVWQNYFYNGSIWINTDGLTAAQQAATIVAKGGNIGSPLPDSIARGSVAAYNLTMETFVQDVHKIPLHTMTATSLFNCFTCHNSPSNIKIGANSFSGNSPLYLSHIFRSYLSVSSGLSVQEIERIRIRDFVDVLKAKRISQ